MTIEQRGLERFVSRRATALPRICSKVTSERVEARRRAGGDVLPLLPFPEVPLPDHLLEAAARAARENRSVPGTGAASLRSAIAAKLEREWDWQVDPDREVVVTNGAMQALSLLFRAILDPGDEVVYPTPTYFFFGAVELAGGRAVLVPTDEAQGWAWDLEAIERAVTPRSKALLVHSPTNPTGRVLSSAELAGLAEIAERHDLLLIYDESFDRLVYDGLKHESFASIEAARRRLVVVQSVTKSYAMSPWRIGYAVAPRPLAEQIAKLLEWEVLMVSHVGQAAAAAAISGPGDWLSGLAAQFERQRDALLAPLQGAPGLKVRKADGSPFLFLNVAGLGLDGDQFWAKLIDEQGVPTQPGSFFGSPGHVRLSFGASVEDLTEAGRRIRSAARM